jgi:hypothetical protein
MPRQYKDPDWRSPRAPNFFAILARSLGPKVQLRQARALEAWWECNTVRIGGYLPTAMFRYFSPCEIGGTLRHYLIRSLNHHARLTPVKPSKMPVRVVAGWKMLGPPPLHMPPPDSPH